MQGVPTFSMEHFRTWNSSRLSSRNHCIDQVPYYPTDDEDEQGPSTVSLACIPPAHEATSDAQLVSRSKSHPPIVYDSVLTNPLVSNASNIECAARNLFTLPLSQNPFIITAM